MHTVKPLQKDWTTFIHIIRCRALPATIGKLVSKLQPLFFHQNTETLLHIAEYHIFLDSWSAQKKNSQQAQLYGSLCHLYHSEQARKLPN